MTNKELEKRAEEANAMGDKNLAITLFAFLGARQSHLEDALAAYIQDWAKKRTEEIKLFHNRKNN